MRTAAKIEPKTILIVDDEPDLCEILAFDFRLSGYRVLVAENAKTALDLMKDNQVDLIVTDVRMPNGDGIDLLENVKSERCSPELIFLTGFSDLTAEQAYNKGAAGLFSKPFDRKVLIETARTLLLSPEERWCRKASARILSRIIQEFESWDKALDGGQVALGNGGFSFETVESFRVAQSVDFRFAFRDGQPAFEGSGVIRWAKMQGKGKHRVGVELTFLSESSMRLYTETMRGRAPVPFIPSE